jgi:hypothetical protein
LHVFKEREDITIDLHNSNFLSITKQLQKALNGIHLGEILDAELQKNKSDLFYSKKDANLMWKILSSIYFVFLEYQSQIMKETSNINFWPHHFDIAMLMFSGFLIEGQDPSNWSYSREHMNYGFLFGDDSITVPYFYVTLYPFNERIIENNLSKGAYWYTETWKGAVLELKSNHLVKSDEIIYFFNEVRNLAPKQFYKELK